MRACSPGSPAASLCTGTTMESPGGCGLGGAAFGRGAVVFMLFFIAQSRASVPILGRQILGRLRCRATGEEARRTGANMLEHDPEKWAPVFGKRSCSSKISSPYD